LSEHKLCPFRKTFGDTYEDHELEVNGLGKKPLIKGEIFGYCLEDRCQMWRVWESEDGYPDGDRGLWVTYKKGEKPAPVAYCGLAGRP